MKKILFLTQYGIEHPSSRYRVYQYQKYLRKKYEIKILPAQKKRYFKRFFLLKVLTILILTTFNRFSHLFKVKKYDIIFIQREIFQFSIFPIFEWIISKLNKNIIFDFDDAIWIYNKYLPKIIRVSKYVVVGNSFLKDYALKYNKNVVEIPLPIDTNRYKIKKFKNKKPVVLGWIGTVNNYSHLYQIKDVLTKLAKKYNIVLKVISGHKKIKIKDVKVIQKKWSLKKEVEDLQSIDIGLMPLSNDEWSKGKGGCKLLQYMGVGVVGVASPVGINNEIINDGKNGFLCENNEEWFQKLSLLIKNFKLRKKMGLKGRKTIEEKYTIEKNVKKLIYLFDKIK